MTSTKSQQSEKDLAVDVGDADDSLEGLEDTQQDDRNKPALAHKETKAVSLFRIILLVVLATTAITVSLLAYFGSRNNETEEFEEQFQSNAQKVIDSFEADAAKRRSAIHSSSLTLSSYAEHSNESWPFVTLPDFEQKARYTIELADIISLFVFPLVSGEDLQEWGEYSSTNQDWYWEGMAIQEQYTGIGNNNVQNTSLETAIVERLQVPPFILTINGEGEESRARPASVEDAPFFPLWQYSPQVPVPIINIDFLSIYSASNELQYFLDSDDNRDDILGPAVDFGSAEAGQGADFTNLVLDRGGGGQYESGPLSWFYTPVYETVQDPTSPLVAILQAFIYWQPYFEGLLPDKADGIIAILENNCDQSYSFGISGQTVEFLGAGDLHDSAYDHLEAKGNVFGSTSDEASDAESAGCTYRIRVYPTEEMEDKYLTNQPLVVAISMFAIFAFTSFAFLVYDRFVEKRHRFVQQTAVQSQDVVHQLFPEAVRDRMYNNKDGNGTDKTGASGGQMMGSKAVLTQFLGGRGSVMEKAASGRMSKNSPPIADEYKECTVYFADLAGFTKWSSSRTPSDVFYLLEALYGEFDKVANKRRVFKVETIGDCYVAVTGLPKPQKEHAVIMTRFATDCMSKMNKLINSEEVLSKLGNDTALLSMRVGMHSGPVTAGVLRGEKARFQLFGDTVNTAARMESNGEKGRVQVSKSTADLLIASGKSKWLDAREDLVEAKGKGSMQTYWVEIGAMDDASVASLSVVSLKSDSSVTSAESGKNKIVEC